MKPKTNYFNVFHGIASSPRAGHVHITQKLLRCLLVIPLLPSRQIRALLFPPVACYYFISLDHFAPHKILYHICVFEN